jgi:hypothetical protein
MLGEQGDIPMRIPALILALAVPMSLIAGSQACAQAQLRSELKGTTLSVYAGDALAITYTFGPDQKYPYFYPVNGPQSGRSVTTETSEPYPHHHSLFFGCDKVNGGNYWQDSNERGQIVSEGVKIVEAAGEKAVFTDTCLWRQPGQDPIMRDTRRVTITVPNPELRLIDVEVTLEPLVDITIEKTNHSLFSARMVPELSVEKGGTLVNAEGQQGEQATFGQKSPWMDYSGTRDGITEGLAIFQHPENPWYPAPWFTRDYGFFSPTPMYWMEGDRLNLPKGESLTLRYRVVVHGGDADEADIAGLWEAYAK